MVKNPVSPGSFGQACNHVKKVVEVLPRDKVTHWRGRNGMGWDGMGWFLVGQWILKLVTTINKHNRIM